MIFLFPFFNYSGGVDFSNIFGEDIRPSVNGLLLLVVSFLNVMAVFQRFENWRKGLTKYGSSSCSNFCRSWGRSAETSCLAFGRLVS